jgi:outer membrane protein OmpA-like peptidoglycan-associated protein
MAHQTRRGSTQPNGWVAGLAAVTVMAWASAGLAASSGPAQSANDANGSAKPAPPKTGPPPCANGEPRDDSGACPVVDDSPATRGFELFSGSLPRPGARPAPIAGANVTSPTATTDTSTCSDGCDLKIVFKTGSPTLSQSAQARLSQLAKALVSPALAGKRYEIAGHTDASGSPVRNQALSQARAEAVTNYLVAHGVAATRLTAKGYGSERLLLQKSPRDPRNRRVEARVVEN